MDDLQTVLSKASKGRDLLDALDEARTLLSDLAEARELAETAETPEERAEAEEEADGLADEEETAQEIVEALEQIKNEIGRDSELIPEADFHGHIVQLVEDCYELPKGASLGVWPWYLDWDRIVSDARMDYTELDIAGTAFMVRD